MTSESLRPGPSREHLDGWFNRAFLEWSGERFTAFAWQRRAFHDLVEGRVPQAVDIPTGCGKTSIIALWVLAYAAQRLHTVGKPLPRRLVWVVHRRTVVDQTTDVARDVQRLVENASGDSPWADVRRVLSNEGSYSTPVLPILPVSTIRGALAEDPSWRIDLTRPSIVVGTVDKLGSRLCFQGYGDGRWGRSFYAGLFGSDAWWLLDEAQLIPAFAENLKRIERARCKEPKLRGIRRLEATTVSATTDASRQGYVWRVEKDDLDSEIERRLDASKIIHRASHWGFKSPSATELAEFASMLASGDDTTRGELTIERGTGRRVVVFVQNPGFAAEIAARLVGAGYEPNHTVGLLTGQLRGFERDRLADSPLFARFKRVDDVPDGNGSILVCTSAGEVGVDFTADHAAIEACYLDAFIQRLGRVNRYGNTRSVVWLFESPRGADVDDSAALEKEEGEGAEPADEKDEDIPEPTSADGAKVPRVVNLMAAFGTKQRPVAGSPSAAAKAWLRRNPKLLAKPRSFARIDDEALERISATSFNELPDPTPLYLFLHGERREPPQVEIVWRGEMALGGIDPLLAADAIDRMTIRQAEILRLPVDQVEKWLTSLESLSDFVPIRVHGKWRLERSRALRQTIRTDDALIVLPPVLGGLGDFGEFSPTSRAPVPDVFDAAAPGARRAVELEGQILGYDTEAGEWTRATDGSAHTARIALDDSDNSFLCFSLDPLWTAGRGDFSFLAEQRMLLDDHHRRAAQAAERIVQKLDLPGDERKALASGTGLHDEGKRHPVWQRAVNGSESAPLAKGPRMNVRILNGYRHELGSVLSAELEGDPLALHAVASHHGWGRPHFMPRHYDTRNEFETNAEAVVAQLERFRTLESQYGRWTLAYLEAILKCADIAGSLK